MSQEINIRQLIINKLTDAQYEQAVKNADELYLTPDDGSGGGTDLPDQTGQSGKFLTTNGSTLSWGSVPAGTVTSVRVQAGTGLSSSQSTAQSSVLNTTISIASGYKLPTTTEWSNKQDALPSQTGQSGKYLTTNGTTMSWATVGSGGTSDYNDLTNKPSINSITLSGDQTGSDLGLVDEADLEELDINNIVPEQTGNSGKFLTTNGSTVAWATVQGGGGGDSLPDQTGQEGKFLTTNGSTASWADVQDSLDLEEMILEEAIPDQSGQSGKFLTTNGTTTAWATVQGGGGDSLPDQSGNDGKFLMTNGSTPSWSEVEDALDLEEFDINNFVPDQTGNSGKFLSTNGSSVYWASTGGGGSGYVPMPTVTTLTNTTYTLSVAENTIYEFSNAITSLTISSVVKSYLESFIYFTTGSSIAFTDNSTLKWGGGSIPSLEANTTYCIAIKNGLAELDKFGR